MAVIPHSKWNNLTNHQILKPQTHQKDMCLAMPRYVIFFYFIQTTIMDCQKKETERQ